MHSRALHLQDKTVSEPENNLFPPDPELPAELRRSLQEADQPQFQVPAALDGAITQAARGHFKRAARRHLIWRRWVPIGAAAAAALAFFLYPEPIRQSMPEAQSPAPAFTRQNPTILDAFALARRLRTQSAPGSEWDYNADGNVDRRDVDALALAAVRLENGT
jgi:hypothetical protein